MSETIQKHLGWEVKTAWDGAYAVEIFREPKTEFRLALLDLSRPCMDGLEALSALRELRPDIPVIFTSGYDEARAMSGKHSELPQGLLQKPYWMEELRALLVGLMGI